MYTLDNTEKQPNTGVLKYLECVNDDDFHAHQMDFSDKSQVHQKIPIVLCNFFSRQFKKFERM